MIIQILSTSLIVYCPPPTPIDEYFRPDFIKHNNISKKDLREERVKRTFLKAAAQDYWVATRRTAMRQIVDILTICNIKDLCRLWGFNKSSFLTGRKDSSN